MDLWTGVQIGLRRALIARGAMSAILPIGAHKVHYYDVAGRGSGPPIILVHGLGSSGTSFSRVMFSLGRRYRRVLVPDLPGNGFSPMPPTGPVPVLEQMEVLRQFTAATTSEPAMMVGNSLGGAMSLLIALRWPELLRGLVLVSPAGARVSDHRLDELLRSLDVQDTKQARSITRRLFHQAPFLLSLFAAPLKKIYGSATVRSILREVKDLDFFKPEVLARLSVPTLLLWGESEKLLPYEGVDYFKANLPAVAHIEVVPGFGHIPQVETPQRVADRIIAFADELRL